MTSRIKFGTAREDNLPERPLPISLLRGQTVIPGSLIVLLDSEARLRICSHARRHVDQRDRRRTVECAGLLAGQAYVDSERQVTFVAIRDAVETPAESQTAGSVRIAPHDFHLSRQKIDMMRLRVVGWYHSHPDYGIFLSQDDRVVVQTLFNASYHVAMVYDPIRQQIGSFFGPDCVRIDPDSDRDENIKQNYVVVDDWDGFWDVDDRSEPGSSGPRQGETYSQGPRSDIVPGSGDDPVPTSIGVPVDPLGFQSAHSGYTTHPTQSEDVSRRTQTETQRPGLRHRNMHSRPNSLFFGLLAMCVGLLIFLVGITIGRSSTQPVGGITTRQNLPFPMGEGFQPVQSQQVAATPAPTVPQPSLSTVQGFKTAHPGQVATTGTPASPQTSPAQGGFAQPSATHIAIPGSSGTKQSELQATLKEPTPPRGACNREIK